MQVTKGTWRMREQCVPGSLSSSPTQELGNEATCHVAVLLTILPRQSSKVNVQISKSFVDMLSDMLSYFLHTVPILGTGCKVWLQCLACGSCLLFPHRG